MLDTSQVLPIVSRIHRQGFLDHPLIRIVDIPIEQVNLQRTRQSFSIGAQSSLQSSPLVVEDTSALLDRPCLFVFFLFCNGKSSALEKQHTRYTQRAVAAKAKEDKDLFNQFVSQGIDGLDPRVVDPHVAVDVVELSLKTQAVLVVLADVTGLDHHLLVANPGLDLLHLIVEIENVLRLLQAPTSIFGFDEELLPGGHEMVELLAYLDARRVFMLQQRLALD